MQKKKKVTTDETIAWLIIILIALSILAQVFGGRSHTPRDDYNQDQAELQWGGW